MPNRRRRTDSLLGVRPYIAPVSSARSILLVDDDEAIRDSLSEYLREEGFLVATAENGQDAMQWLRDHRPIPCVVLLDLMMPVMDGGEFLRAKRNDPGLSPIPVVIITAAGAPFRIDLSPDIKDFIQKPIVLPRLMAALEACAS